MVVHVDAGVLTGEDAAGRCHVEDGPWLSSHAARWLACDADVVAILERDRIPLDVRRARRVIPPRLRLAMQARDQGCRFPGCSVPARRSEGHHIRHWIDGGRTELANLASLCRFHHRRHHEGAFRIRIAAGVEVRFEAADGTPLIPVIPGCAEGALDVPGMTHTTALAGDGGASFDLDHAVSVIAPVRARAPT